MSRYIVKYMNLEKLKPLIIWNGGNTSQGETNSIHMASGAEGHAMLLLLTIRVMHCHHIM